jgi:hypothetical protein
MIVWYDFNVSDVFATTASTDTICSLVTWDGATNTGYTFNTIGLTGIDNGLITFDKTSADTSNQSLLTALTGSTLSITSGDTRLTLNRVTGTTGNFVYPIEIFPNTDTILGDYAQMCGGFYQGYYKIDGSTYEVLPTRANHAWVAQFWLNKTEIDCSGVTGTTLNDTYPNNKGFFFYMGTRAENKFWNVFSGNSTGCTSGCTQPSGCADSVSEWCTIPKETDIVLSGDYGVGIPLNPPLVNIDLITNEFLIYGRARSGSTSNCSSCGGNHDGLGTHTVCTYDGNGIVVSSFQEEITNFTNPFLIYGRARSGFTDNCSSCGGNHDGYGTETVCSFSGFTSPKTTLDNKLDIIDNAIGFRIKDDGSIGYRLITFTGQCNHGVYTSGYTIEESYSASGVVSDDIWTNISIRFVADYLDDCDLEFKPPRKGKLMFYVNSHLKFVVNNFDEFIARRLNEYKAKQIGVPFNISVGGGSQGLLENQTFDGPDPNDVGLPIAENFAGSFIGYISQFKFFICDITYDELIRKYEIEKLRYNIHDSNLISAEDDFLILQENGYGIIWE